MGGHPVFSGSEARGAEHASAEIFDGATWFLTPLAETDPARYRLVHGFVSTLGATPVAVDPQAHDRLVALTSHLPHALANLLVNQAGATRVEGHEPLAAAGGSLRDMTRVAGANPRIWVDIFVENAASLRESLAEHRRRVEQLEAALDAGDVQITVTTPPSSLVVGDYISLAEETPVLQLPDEAFTYLVLLTAKRCLYSIGDYEGMKGIDEQIPRKDLCSKKCSRLVTKASRLRL